MVQGFDALYGVSHQFSLVTSTVSARAGATGTLLAVTPRANSDAAAIAGRIDCRIPIASSLQSSGSLARKELAYRDRQLRVAAPCLREEIDGDSDDDDEAERRLLDRRRHIEHDETALHDLHDERSDKRLADRPAAAEEARAADHDGGDRDKLEADSGDRLRRA